MVYPKIIADILLFLVALPLFAYQSVEMVQAIIAFVADFTGYFDYKS